MLYIQNEIMRRSSAHDISEGGLFISLLESSFPRELGFDVVAADSRIRKDAYWFGESQSRIVVTVKQSKEDELLDILNKYEIEFSNIGVITSAMVYVDKERWGVASTFQDFYDNAISSHLK